eukprot:s6904_g7.t1
MSHDMSDVKSLHDPDRHASSRHVETTRYALAYMLIGDRTAKLVASLKRVTEELAAARGAEEEASAASGVGAKEEIAELNQTINEMRSCWETTQVRLEEELQESEHQASAVAEQEQLREELQDTELRKSVAALREELHDAEDSMKKVEAETSEMLQEEVSGSRKYPSLAIRRLQGNKRQFIPVSLRFIPEETGRKIMNEALERLAQGQAESDVQDWLASEHTNALVENR